MCVCVCVCVYIHTHSFSHAIMYIYTHVYVHTYSFSNAIIYIHTHTYIHSFSHAVIYIYTCVCIYIYMHTHSFSNTIINIHTFLCCLPSSPILRDWIAFPVLYSRTSLLIHSTWNSGWSCAVGNVGSGASLHISFLVDHGCVEGKIMSIPRCPSGL